MTAIHSRTITIAPGQFYEFTLHPGAGTFKLCAGTPDEITISPGEAAVIRVQCLPPAAAAEEQRHAAA